MERRSDVKTRIVVFAFIVCVLIGLMGCTPRQPPAPQVIDAPRLAAALKWVGCCAVICSALGASALVIASRNRRK